jgi:hypothetical protein
MAWWFFNPKSSFAGDLKPWSKIDIDGNIGTVQSVTVCNGVGAAPHHLIGSKRSRTTCALLVTLMDGREIKLHPGEKIRLA